MTAYQITFAASRLLSILAFVLAAPTIVQMVLAWQTAGQYRDLGPRVSEGLGYQVAWAVTAVFVLRMVSVLFLWYGADLLGRMVERRSGAGKIAAMAEPIRVGLQLLAIWIAFDQVERGMMNLARLLEYLEATHPVPLSTSLGLTTNVVLLIAAAILFFGWDRIVSLWHFPPEEPYEQPPAT